LSFKFLIFALQNDQHVVGHSFAFSVVVNSNVRYQPFLTVDNLEVYQISAGQMTSMNFWDVVVDPDAGAGQYAGSPVIDYNPTQDDDDTAIIIVIVVASVVFVCGAGVVIHHFRKKHKVLYADTCIEDTVAVSVSEGTYIGPTVKDNGGGLRVFKAKQVHLISTFVDQN
jgi:hypothetical protein